MTPMIMKGRRSFILIHMAPLFVVISGMSLFVYSSENVIF
jgi:hypothetical protein